MSHFWCCTLPNPRSEAQHATLFSFGKRTGNHPAPPSAVLHLRHFPLGNKWALTSYPTCEAEGLGEREEPSFQRHQVESVVAFVLLAFSYKSQEELVPYKSPYSEFIPFPQNLLKYSGHLMSTQNYSQLDTCSFLV